MSYSMYFDGCSKGNPGVGGAGAVIYSGQEEMNASCVYVGDHVTNNYAEYCGLELGLKRAQSLQIRDLKVYGDSALVINQMNGIYKVKSQNLLEIYASCKEIATTFDSVTFAHVYRCQNKRADELSNIALPS